MNFVIPDEHRILEILTILFGDDMVASIVPMKDDKADWISVFSDDEGATAVVCIANKEFAVYSAAALLMLPPDIVNEAVEKGDLTEASFCAFHEIMNISGRIFFNDHTPHLQLSKVCRRQQAQTELTQIKKIGSRRDFKVSVPRYGAGQLACLVS